MLTSGNYVKDASVIRSGEVIASDPNLKDPDVKTFYHQVPGACTFLSDGAQLTFVGGQYSTKNPDILRHLEAIVDRPGTLVFSRKPGSPIPKEALEAAAEVTQPAGNAADIGSKPAHSSIAASLQAQAKQRLAERPVAVSEVEVAAAEGKSGMLSSSDAQK
jgi:hypothetical protein